MEVSTLISLLDHPDEAATALAGWGLSDPQAARHLLLDLAEAGIPFDLLATLCTQLDGLLPAAEQPGQVLEDVRQLLVTSRSPMSFAALCERDRTVLPMLVSVLSWGGVWRETILRDPEAFDLLRITEGQPVEHDALVADLTAEATSLSDERAVIAALRRLKRREQLRIVYGERVGKHRPELVWQQLTYLAEAIVGAALTVARQRLPAPTSTVRKPRPLGALCVLAFGRCGAGEQDYLDRLQLLIVHEPLPAEDAARRAAADQYERVARTLHRLLTEIDEQGPAYQIEWQPLPGMDRALPVTSVDEALARLDGLGRTWHRQACTQARFIAGDRGLADLFHQQLETWMYRRLLAPADEVGLRALKRRIVQRAELATQSPASQTNIEFAAGGLIDFEQTVQFLRLLSGGDQPSVRSPSTLATIAGLEQAGAINVSERTALEEAFIALRQRLHASQTSPEGTADEPAADDALASQLQLNWTLLSGLLNAAFADEASPPAEVDLLLAPQSTRAEAERILGPYRFRDCQAALGYLNELATERSAYLSTRRCRYYLTSIIGPLLSAIARSPQPDATLANLSRVSDSLGGKGVLWELFQAHPPSLELYVRVCGCSEYLSDLFVGNPGMLDELLDSLQLSHQPKLADLQRTWEDLRRGGGPTLPLLHGFKASRHLQIGVRDILQQEPIETTLHALSDVADVCLGAIAEQEYQRLVEKHGTPTIEGGPFDGEPCGYAVLGLGKLGGQEPNYHSDLQVAFLYDAEGSTRAGERSKRVQTTTNGHFFTQLAQRILKELSQSTPQGRLYPIEATFRPLGTAGPLAISLDDLATHFQSGAAPLWQWQALCKARAVFGSATTRSAGMRTIRQLLTSRTWQERDASELLAARQKLEQGASPLNIKRGVGGTLDIELVVQRLQIEHCHQHPQVLEPFTLAAIQALHGAQILSNADAAWWAESYRFLRRVECGIRLMNLRARHELPQDIIDLERLALLLGYPTSDELHLACTRTMAENRRRLRELSWPETDG